MAKIGLLFPHQLFESHELLNYCDIFYLVEEFLFFKQYSFHKQKLAFHRASMKAYEAKLKEQNLQVFYISAQEEESDIRKLIPAILKEEVEALHYIDPTDEWLSKRIKSAAAKVNLSTVVHENPIFLNSKQELTSFFKPEKKSFFQTSFYKQERNKRNILLEENGNPAGGKWTFDTENRKKYPKGKTPPAIHYPKTSKHWAEAVAYVEENFSNNLGCISKEGMYPISHEEAQHWFEQFMEFRFHDFGAYEDAILAEQLILNHSLLSPLLNVGLLEPDAVVQQALEFANREGVPLNSLEGFIRQIIGWREFIRGMYECKGNESRTSNFWKFNREIPPSFYDGTTGIDPIDQTIKKVLESGYCHHIERLMVLGNFMLLCEFDPNEVYRWFMELFIDAFDWVMVPNVYGMSQFADGGFFATKPYISGSNYLMKMSNYKKGDWQKSWDGLFWRFMHKHQDFFLGNPRISMLVHSFNRMPEEKKQEHLANAEAFLSKLS